MLFNKYLVKISNAVQNKNKENLKNPNNSTQNQGYNGSITTNSIDIPVNNHNNNNNSNNNNNNNKTTRNLEYERAIAASYAASNTHHHHHHQTPKKKKLKINVLNTNDTKTCLTTDELAIIIKGGSNNNKTKRHTLKESSNQGSYAATPPLRETKSSLTLNLSTSPSSSGVYSSYASTPTSLQAPTSSSSRSSSSTESLNSSENGNTPYSSNLSTPSPLPHSGNPSWPLLSSPTTLQISYELAVLRIRMWFYPLVFHFSFFFF